VGKTSHKEGVQKGGPLKKKFESRLKGVKPPKVKKGPPQNPAFPVFSPSQKGNFIHRKPSRNLFKAEKNLKNSFRINFGEKRSQMARCLKTGKKSPLAHSKLSISTSVGFSNPWLR